MSVYADQIFYADEYLVGRVHILPSDDFAFFEKKARVYIDKYTLNRIDPANIPAEVRQCVCELAEYLYMNEGSENKQSESVSGMSANYIQGVELNIIRRYLDNTGLLDRRLKSI
jgi:hypothetical protein